jgi:predicted metal-dependent hydrolase
MTLKISSTGEVIVVTPRFIPQWSIKHFVTTHSEWIEKQLEAIKEKILNKKTDSLLLFGKEYKLCLQYTSQLPAGVHIRANQVLLNPTEPAASNVWKDSHTEQLNRFLKRTARTYIEPRTSQIGQQMSIDYQHLRLKEQKSRWGSCSSDGNLNFNWRLVHCPPEVIDYVIVHELAHRKHMDHSRKFWNFVAQYTPDYQLHRGWLKRHGRFLV